MREALYAEEEEVQATESDGKANHRMRSHSGLWSEGIPSSSLQPPSALPGLEPWDVDYAQGLLMRHRRLPPGEALGGVSCCRCAARCMEEQRGEAPRAVNRWIIVITSDTMQSP